MVYARSVSVCISPKQMRGLNRANYRVNWYWYESLDLRIRIPRARRPRLAACIPPKMHFATMGKCTVRMAYVHHQQQQKNPESKRMFGLLETRSSDDSFISSILGNVTLKSEKSLDRTNV